MSFGTSIIHSVAAPALRQRAEIPDFQLLTEIGRGAYGEVWLARSVTGAYRAIKIVRRDSFEHERPFLREFEAIRKFEPVSREHSSQVDILHVGRTDDYFYYVMELADDQRTGGQVNPDKYSPRTLKSDLLEKGRLPFEECITVALSLAAALKNLHEHGLVHRDIKPSNIIYVNGVAKLADVGLVSAMGATRSLVGTEGFAAPEGSGRPDADLYSLGKVLYEMATGKDRLEFPELPSNLRELPEWDGLSELNAVIVKACRHDPKDRYQNAAELLADLELLQSGKSLARLHTLQRRFRAALLLGAGTTLLTLLMALGWAYHAAQTNALLALAEEKAKLAEENARLAEFQRMQLFKEGIWKEEGKFALFIGGPVTNAATGRIYYLLGSARPGFAESSARLMGGTLATIRNADEQRWIFETFGNWKGIPRNLLIGLFHPDPLNGSREKEQRRKEFRWMSGEPVTYSNWGDPEPNMWEGLHEKYVHIWAPGSIDPGAWNDISNADVVLGVGMFGVVEISSPPQ